MGLRIRIDNLYVISYIEDDHKTGCIVVRTYPRIFTSEEQAVEVKINLGLRNAIITTCAIND